MSPKRGMLCRGRSGEGEDESLILAASGDPKRQWRRRPKFRRRPQEAVYGGEVAAASSRPYVSAVKATCARRRLSRMDVLPPSLYISI